MVEEQREQRVDDGRQAFAVMMDGIRALGVSMHALAKSNTALAGRVGELAARDGELVEILRASISHSAALQEQMGVLVQVISRANGVPTAPIPVKPVDPFERIGRGLVNGVMPHIAGQGRGRPPGH